VITTRADRMRNGPPGRDGGADGRPGRYLRVRPDGETIDLPSKTGNHRFEAGDRFVVETSGGGGLGAVHARDRSAVTRDVTDGRVTRDAAAREYATEVGA
jgi:N-methylhydantoinase B